MHACYFEGEKCVWFKLAFKDKNKTKSIPLTHSQNFHATKRLIHETLLEVKDLDSSVLCNSAWNEFLLYDITFVHGWVGFMDIIERDSGYMPSFFGGAGGLKKVGGKWSGWERRKSWVIPCSSMEFGTTTNIWAFPRLANVFICDSILCSLSHRHIAECTILH